jgi:hypothetical protein
METCSCNGDNANCYKCDGTGFKRERIRITIPIGKKSIQYNSANTQNYSMKRSPEYVIKNIENTDIESLREVHRFLISHLKHEKGRRSQIELCQKITLLDEAILKRSVKREFNLSLVQKVRTGRKGKKKKNKNFTSRKDEKRVKHSYLTHEINDHKTYVHSSTRGTTRKIISDRYLDGSDGFHVFRERGRFGSYSSFDNFSDESFS